MDCQFYMRMDLIREHSLHQSRTTAYVKNLSHINSFSPISIYLYKKDRCLILELVYYRLRFPTTVYNKNENNSSLFLVSVVQIKSCLLMAETILGGEPDPEFLAPGTKLGEQFPCLYCDRYMSID